MRGVIAVLALIGLTAALYLALRPVLHRPPLRVALELRAGDADDAALAAGVALAIEERDGAAGPWRVTAAHQIRHPNRLIEFPTPTAHTMLYGLQSPGHLPSPTGPLLFVDDSKEEAIIRDWMRGRGLERLSTYDPYFRPGPLRHRAGNSEPKPSVLNEQPDVIRMDAAWGVPETGLQKLRDAGFRSPIFITNRSIRWSAAVADHEGAYYVLSPLKAPPPGFRHPNPFAYIGYRGALRYFDALDKDPKQNARGLASSFHGYGLFNEMREEPRVYQVRKGILTPE